MSAGTYNETGNGVILEGRVQLDHATGSLYIRQVDAFDGQY